MAILPLELSQRSIQFQILISSIYYMLLLYVGNRGFGKYKYDLAAML